MKQSILQLSALTAVLALAPLTASAGNSTLQPIHTRFAQTQDAISVELSAWYFTDLELEEADSFDGWSAGAEIVWPLPFNDKMQLRYILPFYTDGDAELTDPAYGDDVGEEIDIDGPGGVYEFMTLQFEHQLFNTDDHGFNGAYYAGAGRKTEELETTAPDDDVYNHTGRVTVGGIKFDMPIFDQKAQWLVNAGVRYYYDTDDLHPKDKDDFTFADLKTAVVFAPLNDYIVPVLEVTYLGDFDYNALALEPEVIIPFTENVSLKVGGIISLSNDGNQGGGAASLAIGF